MRRSQTIKCDAGPAIRKEWTDIVFDRSSAKTYRAGAMRPKLGWFLAGIFLLPSTTWAQDSGATATTPQTQVTQEDAATAAKRPDARRSDELAVELKAVNASKLTNDEKKKNTESMLFKQRAGLALVTDLTADARARKDIVQLNCVNAKRVQLKGLLRLSQQAASTMYEGMATATSDTVNHEYTKIAVASQRSQLLVTEAKQCVGEEAIFAGDTDVTVEISDDIPTVDPTLPAAPPLGPAAPPVASGF